MSKFNDYILLKKDGELVGHLNIVSRASITLPVCLKVELDVWGNLWLVLLALWNSLNYE